MINVLNISLPEVINLEFIISVFFFIYFFFTNRYLSRKVYNLGCSHQSTKLARWMLQFCIGRKDYLKQIHKRFPTVTNLCMVTLLEDFNSEKSFLNQTVPFKYSVQYNTKAVRRAQNQRDSSQKFGGLYFLLTFVLNSLLYSVSVLANASELHSTFL